VVTGTPGVLADLALGEMRIRLAPLSRALAEAVARRSARTPADTDAYGRTLVVAAASYVARESRWGAGVAPDDGERDRLTRMHRQADEAGVRLPLARLQSAGLDDLDLDLVVLAAAPAFEPSFGALYALLQDSFEATAPGPALATRLLATSAEHARLVVEAAGPFGQARATGLLQASVDRLAGPVLRPADGLVELLHGSRVNLALLGLDDPIRDAEADSLPAGISHADLGTLAAAFDSGLVDVVGVWGAGRRGADAVVAGLCAGTAPVRVSATEAAAGLQRASVRGRVCVVDLPSDRSDGDDDAVASVVASAGVPTVLVGVEPLRSPRLWADRRVAELSAGEPGRAEAWHAWSGAFPDLPAKTVDDLTARFALPADDVAAVAALHRTAAAWSVNGSRPTLDQLAARVSRPRSARLATVRTPRRGRELLVLPPAEERGVLQVAEDFRAWPRVAETWRLDRFGGAGMTALFAGDPGTGKTLAAEVIAGEVGLDLMLVDLSLLVSKWVGETEKNLDAVFTEASRSHCVLFFDEADAMFGRRGEVSRGADRYANLEVGYLLQRLDRYDGLVVLATNLRDQLDEAFTRRFDHLVHFPSPRPAERRRIWELVLGPPVRLDGPVDLALLESLELTGAGIAAVVRSAALAVHHDGHEGLTMADLAGAAARQFQRESRLVPPGLLAPDASW
jgi:hypothetical protein